MRERAIENGTALRIVYLKPNAEKSRRVVRPEEVGENGVPGQEVFGYAGLLPEAE